MAPIYIRLSYIKLPIFGHFDPQSGNFIWFYLIKWRRGKDSTEMRCKAPSTPMVVLVLLVLILTDFHSSKALHSNFKMPTFQDLKILRWMAACGLYLPRIQPLLLLIPLSEDVGLNLPSGFRGGYMTRSGQSEPSFSWPWRLGMWPKSPNQRKLQVFLELSWKIGSLPSGTITGVHGSPGYHFFQPVGRACLRMKLGRSETFLLTSL